MLSQNNSVGTISNQDPFCFISIRSITEFVFAMVLILITMVLLFYACSGYRSLQKLGKVMVIVKLIFLFVVLSCVLLIVYFSVGGVYFFENLLLEDPQNPQGIINLSIFNYCSFTFGGFLVQTFLILVTLNIIYNTFQYNSHQGQIFPAQLIKFYKFIRGYIYARCLRLVTIFIMPFYKTETSKYSLINYVCNSIDSLFCFMIMLVCYFFILKPYLFNKYFLSGKQKKWLQIEYLSLVFSALYRFLSVCIFFYIFLSDQDQQCPKQTVLNTVKFFLTGEPLLKIFPLFFTIRMQLPKVSQHQIRQSFLKHHHLTSSIH